MKPNIEHIYAFTVLGIQTEVKRGSETTELFTSIWKKFEDEREAIGSLALNTKYYGVNFPTDIEDVSEYLAGMMVSDDSSKPNGLVLRSIPESYYAVFECSVENIGICYQNIFTKWFIDASEIFDPTIPVFEEYPERDSTLPVRIHVPIIKNE